MERVLLINEAQKVIVKSQLFKNEAELQETVKANPELINLSSIFDSPLLIIGRESDYIDVLAITADAVPVIIECKKKDNPDMRYLIAQVFEYASKLNQKNYNEFDQMVSRYFSSNSCEEERYRNLSLKKAFTIFYKLEISDSDESYDENDFPEQLSERLKNGEFFLIIVVDRISETAFKTVQFLNSKMDKLRIEIVEISKYAGEKHNIFVPKHINIDGGQQKKARPGKTTFEDVINRSGARESEYIKKFREIWEDTSDYSIVMGTKGFSAKYHDIPILWIFPDNIRIASPIKSKYGHHFEPLSAILKKHFTNSTDVTVKFGEPEFNIEKLLSFTNEVKLFCNENMEKEAI